MAGCWVLGAGVQKHPRLRPCYFGQHLGCCHADLSELLVCIPVCQHANNWGCWHPGVHVNSTDMPTFFALLPRWRVINQHANMLTCQQLGMLACWGAPQQHRQNSSLGLSLVGWPSTSMPACQHGNCHARVHASSTGRPAFLAPSWILECWSIASQ